jgi:hypothetical protein
VAFIRRRTIPTRLPSLVGEVSATVCVGEVSATVCGWRDVAWSAKRVPTAVNLGFLDRAFRSK